MKLRYTETARREVDDILAYIAKDNPSAAAAVGAAIKEAAHRLRSFPHIGAETDQAGVYMNIVPAAIGLLLVWLAAGRTVSSPNRAEPATTGEPRIETDSLAVAAVAAPAAAFDAATTVVTADMAPGIEPAAAVALTKAVPWVLASVGPQQRTLRSSPYRTREIRVGASVIRLRFKGAEMQDWWVAVTAPRSPAR
jgi:hypothetical protein